MKRTKLKYGGKPRKKALFGAAEAAIMAGATLAAAGIQQGATIKAAKDQAKAITDSAKTQAQSMKSQIENTRALQDESIEFTKQQNKENRDQQQDIQTTLQLLAGQNNMNDIMESNKMQLKYGGNKNINTIKNKYSGLPFEVTDGGGVVPISVDGNGFGFYELYGNDHEHYHKTKHGKWKSGVGIRFANGEVVEGEGNQNSNKGELMLVTPDNALFFSKHKINGIEPREMVLAGMNPYDVADMQEQAKLEKGVKDDGTKINYKKHRSIKKLFGGNNVFMTLPNLTQNPNNGTAPTAAGIAYLLNQSNKAKYGTRVKLKCGSRRKAAFGDYLGATISGAGNMLGTVGTALGNYYASRKLSDAYRQAGDITAEAYSRLKGIDLDFLTENLNNTPTPLISAKYAMPNINSQVETIRRASMAQKRDINRNILSSAARQQRIAEREDRATQDYSKAYTDQYNTTQNNIQEASKLLTQGAIEAANMQIQNRQNYTNAMLEGRKYNADIENQKILGPAQAKADTLMNIGQTKANALTSTATSLGNAIMSTGNAFGMAANEANRTAKEDFYNFTGLASSERRAMLSSGKYPKEAKYSYNIAMDKWRNATDKNTRDQALADIDMLISVYPQLGFVNPQKRMDSIRNDSRLSLTAPNGTIVVPALPASLPSFANPLSR